MTINEVDEYFGSLYKACIVLEIAPQSAARWKKTSSVPLVHQLKIEKITKGKLIASEREKKYKICDSCGNKIKLKKSILP